MASTKRNARLADKALRETTKEHFPAKVVHYRRLHQDRTDCGVLASDPTRPYFSYCGDHVTCKACLKTVGKPMSIEQLMRKTCGSCFAGIVIMNADPITGCRSPEIHRCDECDLFDTDEDAAVAVEALLGGLARCYRPHNGGTVADALDLLLGRTERS